MATVLTNAQLVDLDPPAVEAADLRFEAGLITARGADAVPSPGDHVIDCGRAVVLPGLVNGHTHLYSALAAGMPPPPRPPRDFHEILRFVWWRLDRALNAEAVEASARIGAIEALRCGTTTLIDHHASPNCIAGSLDAVAAGIESVGVRGVLCYETTVRHGRAGGQEGLLENERFARRVAQSGNGRLAALIGAHAAFTVDNDTLAACAALARELDTGVHIHVLEDPCDEAISRTEFGDGVIERLDRAGVLGLPSLLAHGTHLAAADLARIDASQVTVAHNPRSNMHNRVGYAPIAHIQRPTLLGTDGIGADMFAETHAAWIKSRDAGADLPPQAFLRMLAQNARFAGERLGVRLGALRPGFAADVVITDYVPPTPLTAENLVGHFIFGMNSRHIRTVFIVGVARLLDRIVVGIDEAAERHAASRIAAALWERMQRLSD